MPKVKHGKKLFYLLPFIFVVLCAILIYIFIKPGYKEPVVSGDEDFETLKSILSEIADEKGGAYAIEYLNKIPLADNIDVHLLGHTIGEKLYKEEGLKGIVDCSSNFQYGCAHAVVIGYLLEYGEGESGKINDFCRTVNDSPLASFQCFHGTGHGFLVYSGYDFEWAIKMCREFDNDGPATACIGGAVMELVNGKFHDYKTWEKESVKYFSKDDPLMPCMGDIVPSEAKPMCYSLLTPKFFEYSEDSTKTPEGIDFAKAMSFCDAIPPTQRQERHSCFGGFGREFTGIALKRHFRPNDKTNPGELSIVYELCTLAGKKDGVESCLYTALESLYYGGINSYDNPLALCSNSEEYEEYCYLSLSKIVMMYTKDKKKFEFFCRLLPQGNINSCLKLNEED